MVAATGAETRLNLDGIVSIRNIQQEGTYGYGLFFRSGFLETVRALTQGGGGNGANLPSVVYEQHLMTLLREFREELRFLGVPTEMTALVSVLRANEVYFGVSRDWDETGQRWFDRPELILLDVVLAGDVPEHVALKPVFDLVLHIRGVSCVRQLRPRRKLGRPAAIEQASLQRTAGRCRRFQVPL